jgi:K+-transporting ATPase ATPase C chain
MNRDISSSFRVAILTLILTGIIYPYFIYELAVLIFPHKAKGSLIFDEQQRVIGSELIGQNFSSPAYFLSRPSFAGAGYDGLASGGSNESPTSKKFLNRIHLKTQDLKKISDEKIPVDLVMASGSGLDPHISPQAAIWQAPKIALARDVSLKRVLAIITDQIQQPQFGFIGSQRVNVLKLNLALDQFFGQPITQ